MDPVGATASIVTLADVALRAGKLINGFAQHYREAPNEVVQLKHKIDGVKSQLGLLKLVHHAVEFDRLELDSVTKSNVGEFTQGIIPIFEDIFKQKISLTRRKKFYSKAQSCSSTDIQDHPTCCSPRLGLPGFRQEHRP